MNLFVYSDESGVFDRAHNQIYVFGGIICATKEKRDEYTRIYRGVEKQIYADKGIDPGTELKASVLDTSTKRRLYGSMKNAHKFGVVIDQQKVNGNVFNSKKSKQRYLDYAYKIAVKRKLQQLIGSGTLNARSIENIYFCLDQHTTATDGKYELREAIESELVNGTFNMDYSAFFPPLFKQRVCIDLRFYDSKDQPLIRAADIIANRLWHAAIGGKAKGLNDDKFKVTFLP